MVSRWFFRAPVVHVRSQFFGKLPDLVLRTEHSSRVVALSELTLTFAPSQQYVR